MQGGCRHRRHDAVRIFPAEVIRIDQLPAFPDAMLCQHAGLSVPGFSVDRAAREDAKGHTWNGVCVWQVARSLLCVATVFACALGKPESYFRGKAFSDD